MMAHSIPTDAPPPSARHIMLAERAAEQRDRVRGFTPMLQKPRGHVGQWEPAGEKRSTPLRLVRASINRRTGKPHEHARAKARRLKQIARAA